MFYGRNGSGQKAELMLGDLDVFPAETAKTGLGVTVEFGPRDALIKTTKRLGQNV
jgi:hypothetical protein